MIQKPTLWVPALSHDYRSGEVFLQAFFAPPNAILGAEIRAGGTAERLAPWIAPLLATAPEATILPCRRDNRLYWYGLALTDAQLSALGEDLLALVGPTYSTFRGQRCSLDLDDPIEAAVYKLTGGRAFRFVGTTKKHQEKIWERLELLRTLNARRQKSPKESLRPVGRVLRDFHMALLAGNAEGAGDHLDRLARYQLVAPANLLFLRVQALAAFERWDELLGLPDLPDLVLMRRPVAVTEALLRALYRTQLSSFEDSLDPDGSIGRFRESVLPRYAGLLTRRAGLRAPDALKMMMLLAVSGTPPDLALKESLCNAKGLPEQDAAFLRLLADRLPSPPDGRAPSAPMVAAIQAERRGDYDLAFTLATEAPEGIERARLLILLAYDLQTLEAGRVALEAVGALKSDEQASCLRSRAVSEAYNVLAGVGRIDLEGGASDVGTSWRAGGGPAATLPGNWADWMDWALHETNTARAVEVGRIGSAEWTVDELVSLPMALERLQAGLNDTTTNAVLQYALPHLVAFFARDSKWPRPELRDTYYAILLALAAETHGAKDDVTVSITIADGLFSLGLDPEEYVSVGDLLRHLLTSSPSVDSVAQALEILDVMVESPCPTEGLRGMLLADVAGLLNKYRRRLDPAHRRLYVILAEEMGQPEMGLPFSAPPPGFEQEDGDTPASLLASLEHQSVAIYTLTDRAGKQMRRVLEEQAPGVKVHLANDKDCSVRLRQLAGSASLFIVATASATHAGTDCIRDHRPKDLPLLLPTGKGVGSMLSALMRFLETGRSSIGAG